MPLSVTMINQLDMARTMIVSEVPASNPAFRAWVAVHPKLEKAERRHWDARPKKDREQRALREENYLATAFELRRELSDTEYFGPEEILRRREALASTIQEVEKILLEWGARPEKMQVPWRCDYPL